VVPKAAVWPNDRDIFVPLNVGPNPDANLLRRDNMLFLGLARLKPEAPIEQANAALGDYRRPTGAGSPGVAQRLEQSRYAASRIRRR
jgi:hypothetical protein